MSVRNSVQPIPLTSIDSATIIATYLPINPLGLPKSCFLLRIINDSSKDVTVSYDGVTDHDFVAALTSLQLPFQSNSQPNNFVALFPVGKTIYVKGSAGTGNIYVVGYYQSQGV